MGYLSKVTSQSIDQVIQAGQGLSFVVYPYAVTTIKGAPFWSILFFIMMLALGTWFSQWSILKILLNFCIVNYFRTWYDDGQRRNNYNKHFRSKNNNDTWKFKLKKK